MTSWQSSDHADDGAGNRPMVELPAPEASANATEHADWLELNAIVSKGSVSSPQHLKTVIRRSGTIDAVADDEHFDDSSTFDSLVEREDENLERIADAAFETLSQRCEYLGGDYPFSIGDVLKADDSAADSPYAFLTALSYFGAQASAAPESPASLFELLSKFALAQYLGGPAACSYHFGFPRIETPKSFRAALDDLCRKMGEGIRCKVSRPKAAAVKDAKLDLVAWIPFRDGRTNQLSVFGQCTTSKHWTGKINELQPGDFCRRWMLETPAVLPLSAFFVPSQITTGDWDDASIGERRICFDRLRIARLTTDLDRGLLQRCAAWTGSAIT